MFQRTQLGTLDPEARARAMNRVYEDYVVPVQMTAPQLAAHVETHDVRLDESPLWLDDAGEVAALGLLGVRGPRGWIGGFGVAVPHRGLGHSRALVSDMLERARRLGLGQVQLEVITRNPIAVRTYARAGFETVRDLRVLVRSTADAPIGAETSALREVDPDALLRAVGAAPDVAAVRPCWQREPGSILDRGGLDALALGPGDLPRAFAVYAPAPSAVRIVALHVDDEADMASLLAGIVERCPGRGQSVTNEPEGSPCEAVLEALGFEERMRQHEMVVRLAG
jgi:ribosomal protein S18 acetylase RimI-like enzyme